MTYDRDGDALDAAFGPSWNRAAEAERAGCLIHHLRDTAEHYFAG